MYIFILSSNQNWLVEEFYHLRGTFRFFKDIFVTVSVFVLDVVSANRNGILLSPKGNFSISQGHFCNSECVRTGRCVSKPQRDTL